MKIYRCENGYYYKGPQRSCLFCKHCTDVFWDHTNGPYMFHCELGLEFSGDCNSFEDDPDDPDIKEVEDENI